MICYETVANVEIKNCTFLVCLFFCLVFFIVFCLFLPSSIWHSSCLTDTGAHTVYPKKYAHGFVVLCFVVVMQSFIMNSHEVFIHIHQGCFADTGAIFRLPQCQWSKPDGYGKISQCITTTKHSKAKTVCIFLGIYCKLWLLAPVAMCAYLLYYIPSDINNDEYCAYDLMYLCIYYMAIKLIHCHCHCHCHCQTIGNKPQWNLNERTQKNVFWKGHRPNGGHFASASLCCVIIPVFQASYIYVRFMSRLPHIQFWQIDRLFSKRRKTLLVCWGLLLSFERDRSAVFKTEIFRTYFSWANLVFLGIRGLKWYLDLCQKLDCFFIS